MANSPKSSVLCARHAIFCQKLYNKNYFEVARRLGKRSLLGVNEHFPDKADAERALLYGFLFYRYCIYLNLCAHW